MNPKSLTLKFAMVLLSFIALTYAQLAMARVTCTPSAPTFSTAYGSLLNVTAGSFTVTCSESRAGRTATATYQVSASLGINFVGALRYAKTAGAAPNTLNYDLASDSGCANTWNNTTALLPPTPYTTPSITSAAPDIHTFYFWGCVPAGLTVPKNGTYTDSVTLTTAGTVTGDPRSRFRASTMSVSITAPASCTFSTAPGNMAFAYTSNQGTAAAATPSSYALTCNNMLPYSMSLDVGGTTYTGSWASPTGSYTNTASGLSYTLTLSAATATGTGVAQNFTINGSMPANQGGTCSSLGGCTFVDTHTLTVSF